MTTGAAIALFVNVSIALIANQGIDGYGFWTASLWMSAAFCATIVVKIHTNSVETPLEFIYFLAGFAFITFLANYRSHAAFLRLLADAYTFTIGPVHLLAWAAALGMKKIIHGRNYFDVPSPWPVVNYKPSLSAGRAQLVKKRREKLTFIKSSH